MRCILSFVIISCFAAAASGAVINVPAGGNLQTAIDSAQLGDTITLQPGATYSGTFKLRNKTGSGFLTITTATPNGIPAGGTRITPAAAGSLARIVGGPNDAAVRTDAGAHHYRLVGLELTVPAGSYSSGIVQLGSGSATQVSGLASNIELDRVYIHGDANTGAKVGVILNSASSTVKNSYISNIKHKTQDTQAIVGYNGPGPFIIENNYLEAAGENVMFGGATPPISGMIPSDITLRRNHFTKPLAWKSQGWWVKNLLEFKFGQRVLVEGNVLENNWDGADQFAFAIVLTVRTQGGKVPWAVVQDITIQKNIIRHSSTAVNILGKDSNVGVARNIVFRDNLFYDLDQSKWGNPSKAMFQILAGPSNLTIDHNTLMQSASNPGITNFDGVAVSGFTFQNNIVDHGIGGVSGSGAGDGNPTLTRYAPGGVFQKNAVIAGVSSKYPANNFYPANHAAVGFTNEAGGNYALTAGSPYKNAGTDGQDLGADIAAINEATEGVTDGTPNSSQPPTAVSVSPSGNEGAHQVFQFAYSDEKGFANISSAYMLFNGSINQAAGCSVKYDADQNSLFLRDDAGAGWLGPVVIGTGGGVSNSQCTLAAGNSAVGGSGKALQVDLDVTFAPTFIGLKNIYMYATNKDAQSGSWVQRGTWTAYPAVVNHAPVAVSSTPNTGAGLNRTFTLLYSDQDGATDVKQVLALFGTSTTVQANGCYIQYLPASNEVYLRNDAGTAWLGPGHLNTSNPGSLLNRQCKLDTGASTAVAAGTNFTLTLAVLFKPAFIGTKSIFMSATDQSNATTNWQSRGSWIVRNTVPSVGTVSPQTAQGVSSAPQPFQLVYSDVDGYQDIKTTEVLFNTTTSLATGCYVEYVRDFNQLWLRNDAGTAWTGPITPGTSTTLQNSRCTLYAANAAATALDANRLQLTIGISFKNTFTGKKNIYMKVTDASGAASALVLKGSYQITKAGS